MVVDSLKNTLLIAKTGLDERLVSSEAISQISQIADLLPTFPTASQAGLECHLGVSQPTADFFAAFSSSNYGRETLARGYQPLANLDNNPVWSRVYDFCEHWIDTNSPLYHEVDRVWLEFDLVNPQPSKMPEPNFFFGTAEGIKNEAENTVSSGKVADSYSWVTDEALRLLLNKPLPDSVKQKLLVCFNSLPPEGRVFQVGVMLPRKAESQMVRLCIKNIAIANIPQYLSDIDWQGSIAELKSILADLSPFVNFISLNLAVGDTVFPKIGLECYIDKKLRINPKWRLFLDYLVEQQLCTPEKADALLNYPGYSVEKSHQDLWPSNLSNASAFVYPNLSSTIIRLLHHIKIVYQPDKPLKAKAYLWLGHLWLSSRGVFEK
jgi:hypothetical protein